MWKQNKNRRHAKKIVTFGGGTGHYTVLRGLADLTEPSLITAVPSSWDDGGSSGRLRTEMGVLPAGDSRQCLLALMEDEDQRLVAQQLFNDRFVDEAGPLAGHSLGNLIFARLERTFQGQDRGLEAAKRLFRVHASITPPTLTNVRLNAKTQKGIVIEGETNIDYRKKREDFESTDRIHRLYFDTIAEPNPMVIKALKEADLIVFSPGDLYTSVLPHLLVDRMAETILKSDAKVFFVLNLMTKRGETDYYNASDCLAPFLHYLGDKDRLNYLVVNENRLDEETLAVYREEGQEPILLDEDECHRIAPKTKIIKRPLAHYDKKSHLLRHDSEVLAKAILEA